MPSRGRAASFRPHGISRVRHHDAHHQRQQLALIARPAFSVELLRVSSRSSRRDRKIERNLLLRPASDEHVEHAPLPARQAEALTEGKKLDQHLAIGLRTRDCGGARHERLQQRKTHDFTRQRKVQPHLVSPGCVRRSKQCARQRSRKRRVESPALRRRQFPARNPAGAARPRPGVSICGHHVLRGCTRISVHGS
jgi:hypothetical protein